MREQLQQIVHKVCQEESIQIYGSFKTGNFHLSRCGKFSYSDIDGITKTKLPTCQLSVLSKRISNTVYESSRLKIRVSIKNYRPHPDDLEEKSSYIVSGISTYLELLRRKNLTNNYLNYLKTKFYLRTIFREVYFNYALDKIAIEDRTQFLNEIINLKLSGGSLSPKTTTIIESEINNSEYNLAEIYSNLNKDFTIDLLFDYWLKNIEFLRGRREFLIIEDLAKKIEPYKLK